MALDLDLDQLNAELRQQSPEQIIRWAAGLGRRVIATTSFAPNAAVMLNLIHEAAPRTPVVWVDSGYNVRDTYKVAEQLMQQLDLNMHIYIPQMTAERRNALMGGIPMPGEPEHAEFTRQVKLEPFRRALDELQPEVWLTGIRREETEFRQGLDILSMDNRGILKVAPIFYWSDADVADYMARHQLPSPKRYFDPTKGDDKRECGLHTSSL